MIRRIFPYSDHKVGKRGCIYSHIGLCNPCPSEISALADVDFKAKLTKVYKKNIRSIRSILDGNIDKLTKELDKEMLVLSKTENYEDAAKVRNQLTHLEYITRPQMPTEFYIENPNLYEDIRTKELSDLKKLLVNCKLKIENCTRIECYDIAHLSGTNATASMVTFVNGEPDKTLYRHFKIREAKGGDDYAVDARGSG